MTPGTASETYLLRRLAVVEARVRAAVERRRSSDPDPDDRFRGLYISDADVDRLLAAPEPPTPEADDESTTFRERIEVEADDAEAAGIEMRLRRVARSFALDGYDVELLLIALAPDLDPRFERFYAYLHDDVSRRRASTGLALELCGVAFGTAPARSRFDEIGPLVGGRLLIVEESDRPFLTRSLRVPDRVAGHLLGDDAPDPTVAAVMTTYVEADVGPVDELARSLRAGVRLVYALERVGAAGRTLAATALARAGMQTVAVDVGRLDAGDDVSGIAALAAREAKLRGAGLVAGPVDVLAERGPAAVRAFAEVDCPVILTGARGWDPGWSRGVPLLLDAHVTDADQRRGIWRHALAGDAPKDLDSIGAQFRLTPDQVVRAAAAARNQAIAEGRAVTTQDLQSGARAQNAAGLERLARRIEPRVGWDDLVLPALVLAHLRQLSDRARHRDRVMDSWGMGKKSSKGRGISALFAGESGTGKTMSAEVIAFDLGLDLYVIDLSTVIDKYIGETEKNLDRIFSEADRVNGVLLFDEADAIFGKRSEVKDSHDRYANVEVAYLLQRMELFDGLAVLTTNLRSNLDEAFTRRLDAIVDFAMPDQDDRRRLWERNLKDELPRAADIDIDFLAKAFKLSGGNIRNIAVTAAYLAAAEDRPVTMAHLVRGTESEYRKLGRLCVEAEFGPYYGFLSTVDTNGAAPASLRTSA